MAFNTVLLFLRKLAIILIMILQILFRININLLNKGLKPSIR